jgi:hypothetical protein
VLVRVVLMIVMSGSRAFAVDYFIATDGHDGQLGTQSQPFATIARAIEVAQPGDRVLLFAGVYRQNTDIRVSGAPERPITITSRSQDPAQFAVIDGGASPGSGLHNEGFRLQDAAWITLRNLEFINCWTDVITLTRSSYISVQGCRFIDTGQHAVSTRDPGTHHILAEGNLWSQDKRIWTTWDWAQLHHGELAHYNGGFYGGGPGAGSAIIRDNTIRYAFNGLRWWLNEEHRGKAQSNIEIYDNVFEHCLDNFVEPEGFTANLHVYHNVFDACPKGVFSIDKVEGGPIYIYGNVGRWRRDGCTTEKPWTIYKFSKYGAPGWLDEPLFLLHNSWDYMSVFGASGAEYQKAEDHLRHFNNAYSFQGGKDFGFNGWLGQNGLFDYDMSSAPWPRDIVDRGLEVHGLVGDPLFVDPLASDYRLRAGSAAIDGGKILMEFTQWYLGDAPDIGAYEGDQRVYGPPFQYVPLAAAAPLAEKPRVVRCFTRGRWLAIFFSADLDPASLTPTTVALGVDGVSYHIEEIDFPAIPRAALLHSTGHCLQRQSWI